ncbi:MAG: DUF4349 domain-containing protein [Acetobacterium sp.]
MNHGRYEEFTKQWRARVKKFGFKQYFFIVMGIILLLIIAGSIFMNLYFFMAGRQTPLLNTDGVTNYNQSMISESTAKDQGNSGISSQMAPEAANSQIPFDISKIVYSGNISLYAEDYQSTFDKIGEYAVGLGGFIQDSNASYMNKDQNTLANTGYITIRVPAEKFTEAMKEIMKYGTPISSSVNSTNISQQYQDIKGQLDNLIIEEARLVDYLTKADNITDLLLIETELNRVRTEIDNRSTIIKNWDKEIAYSTIYVSIIEKEFSGSTVKSPFSDLIKQLSEGFITSINLILNMVAGLIVWIFRLIPFAAVLGGGYFVYTRIRKKKQ